MPTFGTIAAPVRSSLPIEVNQPDGFMTEPPGDLWWIGLHAWWETSIPSSVTKAESVLVNPLIRMPWVVDHPNPDGTATSVQPGDPGYPVWLADPMLANGSSGGGNLGAFPMLDRATRFDFWAWWAKDAMRYGWGLFSFTPGTGGQPRAGTLKLHSPWRLYRGEDGWALDVDGELKPVDEDGTVGGQRLVVLRHSIPGGVFGRHRAELTLANRSRRFATEALDSGVPSGTLETDQPINQTQSNEIRAAWEELQIRRRIAVLGNGAKYHQVVMSPVDAEIVSLSQLSDKQVAHMYELSAWELDAPSGDSNTYANVSEKRQDRVDGPLASWSARIEEALSALMPWGTRLRIDFGAYRTITTTAKEAGDGTAAAA